MKINWYRTSVEIHWEHCSRQLWPAQKVLVFGKKEMFKICNVLLYWWQGEGVRSVTGRTLTVQAGDCHWSRPGWRYQCRQNPQNPLGVNVIYFDLVDERGKAVSPDEDILPPEKLNVSNTELTNLVTQYICELAMSIRSRGVYSMNTQLSARELLKGLLIKLAADTPQHDSVTQRRTQNMVQHICIFIHQHLEDDLPVSRIAADQGVSAAHLSRLFKRQIGVSLKQYIINARIEKAKDLLKNTELTVGGIADAVGVNDVFYFSKLFKKHACLPPTQYRKSETQGEL